ncbi:MAG: hypothetical protein LDL53_07020 [Candidatus Hydrogenedens sp.]|nr:hypothetical protein [Candidatus Hydrogenedens sp.]
MSNYRYKIKLIFAFVFVFHIFTLSALGIDLFKRDKKEPIKLDIPTTSIPVLWAKPLKKTIKILAIAPRYAFLDFMELEKRLDCSINLIATEDALHLGCDPLWGQWCLEDERNESLSNKIQRELEKKWDLLIISGIDLNILPKNIYEIIIQKVAEGKSFLFIPLTGISSTPHPIFNLLDMLDTNMDPVAKWTQLFSGQDEELTNIAKMMSIKCVNYEKGRITCLDNYIMNVNNHVLLPDKAVIDKPNHLENAWAGLISLLLWTCKIEQKTEILSISDAKPAGPIEEEIPPDLSMMLIRNTNQSLLGPGTYPFYIEINKAEKGKFDHVKIQIRRENDNYYFQQYDFKYIMKKKGHTFTQIEIPIGDGTFFIDAWLMNKTTVINFFTKKFKFTSWPEIVSIEADKKVVYPNDSVNLKVKMSTHFLENREGSIVVQAIENGMNPLITEGTLISEQVQYITGEEKEIVIPIRFADVKCNYIKLSVWGLPFKVSSLGNSYSSFFSNKYIYLPVQKKLLPKEWKNFIAIEKINEYNQSLYGKIFEYNLNCGVYLPWNQFKEPYSKYLTQPFIVQVAEESTIKAGSKNQREPCINDETYLEKSKSEITHISESVLIPTPKAFSLGLNNCLVQSEEAVCFCDKCIDKYLNLSENIANNTERISSITGKNHDEIREYILNQEYPSIILTNYQKFMSESFLNYENELKNRLKLLFPNVPIGFRIFPGKESIRGIDLYTTMYSMDWLAFNPDPFLFTFISSQREHRKNFWTTIDFSDPSQAPEKLTWDYWNSLLNQANGVWFISTFETIHNSSPIKLLNEKGEINYKLASLYNAVIKTKQGLGDFILQLSPDIEDEIGIYYSTENLFFTNYAPEFDYKKSATNFIRILNGAGFNPIVVTKDSLLSSKNVKVLILPCFLNLTDSDIIVLSEFAKKGTLIADIIPVSKDNNNDKCKEIINNDFVLLGESLAKDIKEEPKEKIEKIIALITETIQEKGIKSRFLPDNKWFDGKFFSFDNYRVIAWLPNITPIVLSEESSMKQELIKDMEIFDVLKEEKTKKIKINSNMKEPLLLVSNPYKIENINVLFPKIIKTGNRIPIKLQVNAKTKEANYLKHWIFIELKTNIHKGKTVYSSLIQTDQKGIGETYIPIPLNQPNGWYYISAWEITSGIKEEQLIKIEK